MRSPVRRSLPFSGIRAVFNRASELERAGRSILHLEIGRPDWHLPPTGSRGVKDALDEGFVHYVNNRGLLDARLALSTDIEADTGRRFDPETELIITTGASEAVAMAALALLGPGDELLIPEPAWSHYAALAELAGATPVPLPADHRRGFALEPDRVAAAITPNTRMIIINSPGNPTGAVQPPEVLEAIAKIAMDRGIFVVSDEVYRHFVYDGEHTSIARYMGDSELLIYINSFSKSFAMTGFRLGYVAASSDVSDALNRVHQYLTVCGVAFAQRVTAGLLQHSELPAYLGELREAFRGRRQVWLDAFETCPGVELVAPGGGFYLFPRVDHRGMSGREFATLLLEEHGVALVPGDVFGADFTQHVRISYGRDLDTQRPAAERVAAVLRAG